MNTWHERAMELYAQGYSKKEISDKIEAEFGLVDMYNTVRCYIYKRTHKRHKKNEQLSFIPEETPAPKEETKRVVIQNQEPQHYEGKWDGTRTLRFALMGDTQFGSKYAQITHLHNFYDLCEREGITTVYHTGDITDGLKMRPGHEYELYEISADGQCDDVIKNYPRRKGITTHFITGNHDASLYKHVGFDIGKAIAKEREDMIYLGRDCAIVDITPECNLELRHPWDGTAYAISYKIQKMIEAMEADSKPNILVVGHYHKQEYIFYRNIHALQTACFQSQTPFTRGKGISVVMGGYIITAEVDKNGYIQGFTPTFIPYYKSIKDDYKNFKR